MTQQSQPPKRNPATAARPVPAPTASTATVAKISFGQVGLRKRGSKVLLYGTGGIGKSTLAAALEGRTAFFDLEESLEVLKDELTESGMTVPVTAPAVASFLELRRALQADGWNDINNIVIDSITKVEELCAAHTIHTVPHERGHKVTSIEGYGFGKGFQFVYDQFLPLLADLEKHTRAGRNVILIAHECTSTVPNPQGDDWLRYEPRLQNPKSGNASIRLKLKEWVDHMLFFSYDIMAKDKKAQGSGTRTLYCQELPFCMAKSRTCSEAIPIPKGFNPWPMIIK